MNSRQMNRYRTLLVNRMNESLNLGNEEGLKKIYDATEHLPDVSDFASLETLREVTYIITGKRKQSVREIQDALTRIEKGSFGRCEACGHQISEKRLLVYPATNLCIRCKKRREKEHNTAA